MENIYIGEETRERLIRVESCQNETNRRLEHLLELSDALVRTQERESARDGKIEAILTNLKNHENEIYRLNKVKNWGSGAVGILMAVIVPLFSYGIKSTYELINSVDRRVVVMQTHIATLTGSYPRLKERTTYEEESE